MADPKGPARPTPGRRPPANEPVVRKPLEAEPTPTTPRSPDQVRTPPTRFDPAVHEPLTKTPTPTPTPTKPSERDPSDTQSPKADLSGIDRLLKQTPVTHRPPAESAPSSPAGPSPLPPPQPPPDGARVWYNRSADPDAPYSEMQGPDIAYADGVWYARHHDGTWQPFHEGPILDPGATTVVTEAMQYEAVAGTSMFPLRPSQLDLRIDGETGRFVTPSGTTFDPHDLEYVRAADGTRLWHDTSTGAWWSDDDLGVDVEPIPPGPYVTLARGDGAPPPLDDLGQGESLVFDPDLLRYSEPDSGHIVGFHQSQDDELRRWENRSGDDDAGYYDMQGPDIVYLDGIWYGVVEGGRYVPFHEGPVLDLHAFNAPFGLEYLHYELLAGTPLFGQGDLGDLGLRLDGERGVLIDAGGEPIDPFTYDPLATDTDDPDDGGAGAPDGLGDDLVGDITTLDVDDVGVDTDPDAPEDDDENSDGVEEDAVALADDTAAELIGLDDATDDLPEVPTLDESSPLDGGAGVTSDADLAPPDIDDEAGFDDLG